MRDRQEEPFARPSSPAPRQRRVWDAAWRVTVAAIAGAVTLGIVFGMSIDLGADRTSARFAGLVLLDVAVGCIAVGLLPLRRRAPVVVGGLLAVGGAVSASAWPAALLALVSVATRRRPVEIAIVSATWVVAVMSVTLTGLNLLGTRASGDDVAVPLVMLLVVLAATVAVGASIGARRALVMSLRERAVLVEEEQRLRESAARNNERTRIAREMHDVLAHRLSLTAVHASALRYRTDLDPDERVTAIETVHENAREALGELREVLALVRDPESSMRDRPQPTLTDLDALLSSQSGVELHCAIDVTGLAVAVSRHAYRIIQECLTNARRHAPGVPVRVRIDGSIGEHLGITVVNAIVAASDLNASRGFGLMGVEERACSVGGTVDIASGPVEHRVAVTLPWAAA
ncbi:histidine kinase [Microbacterium sp. LWH13-1.2]|uniref:sensor histidine kinase n=1 Tax=Microbacterium sp. LWH13-1.2 TaxID=3135260 RepID=UPI00313884DC